MRIRPADFLLIFLSVLAVGAFSLFAYTGRGTGASVIIEASTKRWIYPIAENRRVAVAGPLGNTIVVISDGKAYVEDSPCRDKICIQMGRISKPGQWIACLPNRVMVRVGGGGDGGKPDDVSF
jgi:hypothetical protein